MVKQFKFKGVIIPGFWKMATEEKIAAKLKITKQRRYAKEDAVSRELYQMVKDLEDETKKMLGDQHFNGVIN